MPKDTQPPHAAHRPQGETPRPVHGEAPFHPRELFFSRTDKRGVILAGNSVFQRVADYPWETLLGAPHKIIRHPDMPRAVFWLLWQAIAADKPIGAYVKNRARDGLHYWVFAMVSPVEDGYMSVRIKPTSPLLAVVEAEYAALRAREQQEKLSPQDSAGLLTARLAELGFPTYESFQSLALLTEMTATRDKGDVRRREPAAIDPLLTALQKLSTLKTHITDLETQLGTLTCTLVNMRLIASRLEGANGPISLMAQNYATVLGETKAWLQRFARDDSGDLSRISVAIWHGAFDFGLSVTQRRAVGMFLRENMPPEAGDKAQEAARLQVESDRMMQVAETGLGTIVSCTRALERAIQEVRRSVAGLNSTRMMCRAEAARLGSTGTFASIIDTLDESQSRIELCADAMLDDCHYLRAAIGRVADTFT